MDSRIGVASAALLLSTTACLGIVQARPSEQVKTSTFDILRVLPPAPRTGDARDRADRAIFRDTRKLKGTPRWALAINDVGLEPADMLRDFSCSVGVALTPGNAPRTVALVTRAIATVGPSIGRAKDFYARPRPYRIDRGAICQPASELKPNADYPSGHTTLGWTWATLLAEAAPDRATDILARGSAFGESRIVCGVHSASAVEAGRMTAAAALTPLDGNQEFRAELEGAREEIAGLRGDSGALRPDSGQCAAERALVAQRVY